MGYVEGSRPLQLGQQMAGRAVTLRFVPHRPDLADDKPKGDQSAEYVAFELCGPGEVLVIDAMRWQYSSIGGDIKFLRLRQRDVGGLVTDGAARDSKTLKEYGFPVYCAATTAKQGPAEFWPLAAGFDEHNSHLTPILSMCFRMVSSRLTVAPTTFLALSLFHFSIAQVVMSDRLQPLKCFLKPSIAYFSRW